MNLNEVVNDFARRYQDTYVLVRFPGEETKNVFHVNHVQGDDTHGAVLQLSSNEYGKISLNFGTGHDILFEYPNIGTFQFGRDALCFRRIPLRQYRRGLCSGNAAFSRITDNVLGAQPVPWTWDTVNAAFAGAVYSFQDALKMLRTGKYRSVALRAGMALCLSLTKGKDFLLFLMDVPIAYVSQDGENVKPIEAAFETDIKNLIAY